MKPITVRFFSILREEVGTGTLELDPASATSIGQALDVLSATYPAVARFRPVIRVAVNRSYTAGDGPLAAGDEIALITPVSGG